MKFRPSLILAFVGYSHIVLGQWHCDFRLYGRPHLDDCTNALALLPDASTKTQTAKLEDPRKFVEPQFLEPPFSRCDAELASMEQVPKFWRYKSCRVALTSVATPSLKVIDPQPVSTWSFIESRANNLFRNCLARKQGGGFTLIADPFGNGAISVYIYTVGAPFEAILNNYMITATPLYPLGVGSAFNDTVTSLMTNASLELISVPQKNESSVTF